MKSSAGRLCNHGGDNATYALELRDLRKSFGKTEIIRGANLAVAPGERVAIIGPNGAGKSTLFNLISGRLHPPAATCILNGQRINGMAPYEINRRGLSRSFHITNIFPSCRCLRTCAAACCGAWATSTPSCAFSNLDDANERAKELMEDDQARQEA